MLPPGLAFGGSAFNPASLPLSGYWLAPYAGAPWTGLASAGASGGRTLVTSGAPATDPDVGATLNGYAVADCDGAPEYLNTVAETPDFFTQSALTMAVLLRARTAVPDPGTADPYSANGVLTFINTGLAGSGLHVCDDGVIWGHYSTGWLGVKAAATLNTWVLAQATCDGSTMRVRANGGGWASASHGIVDDVQAGAVLTLGRNYASTVNLDGEVAAIFLAQSVLSDGNLDRLRAFCSAYFSISV